MAGGFLIEQLEPMEVCHALEKVFGKGIFLDLQKKTTKRSQMTMKVIACTIQKMGNHRQFR